MTKIDKRTQKDIEATLKRLSQSYTPEWNQDFDNPDIGSVISLMFAMQMSENIDRYNQILDKYRTEFVNMIGVSLLPAKPASAIVSFDVGSDTVPGSEIPKGTKLIADNGQEAPLVFETDRDVYATSSRLSNIFMSEEDNGCVYTIRGEIDRPEIYPGEFAVPEGEEATETIASDHFPFSIFRGEGEGVGRDVLSFYARRAFDVCDNDIYVRIEDNEEIKDSILKGEFSFFGYRKEEGLFPINKVRLNEQGDLVLSVEGETDRINVSGTEYNLLVLKANKPIMKDIRTGPFTFSTKGVAKTPSYLSNGSRELDVESCAPFSDELSLFSEFFICDDNYFSKAGAHVEIQFDARFPEKIHRVTPEQEQEELKVIKRKEQNPWRSVESSAKVQEIAISYYNGTGWRKLECDHEYSAMFSALIQGHYNISFTAPADWESLSVDAYTGRCVRIQLLAADNCYMRPCVHHYPVIEKMTVEYTYENTFARPDMVKAIAGTKTIDLTKEMAGSDSFSAFMASAYSSDSLYLGFNKPFEKGPISMLFTLEDGMRYEGTGLNFFYRASNGFKPLSVMDFTDSLQRTGVMMFLPPSDMVASEILGKKAYWIRIDRQDKEGYEAVLPLVKDITVNAVQVTNVETQPEQDFYLEQVAPNQKYELPFENILDCEVWVNETRLHTVNDIRQMIAESPSETRAEYNNLGELTSFYRLWKESEYLDGQDGRRVYSLDRMSRTLSFGDGIAVDIPRTFEDVAFKVIARTSLGALGNVPAETISASLGYIRYVDEITNPMKAYGGDNMESIDMALKRGANIISTRKRLVSLADYKREIMSYSDLIDKCEIFKNENGITVVLLLKDYEAGSFSFHNMASNLKKHLLERGEYSIPEAELHIIEPIFVNVDCELWLKVGAMDDTFAIRAAIEEELAEYLSPVSSEDSDGFRLGTLPSKAQISMRLAAKKQGAYISNISLTGVYQDEAGIHEIDLDDLEPNKFMIPRNGNHKIHISLY